MQFFLKKNVMQRVGEICLRETARFPLFDYWRMVHLAAQPVCTFASLSACMYMPLLFHL